MFVLNDVVCQRTPSGAVWLRLHVQRDGADSYKSYTIAQAEDLDNALEDAQITDHQMIEVIQKKVFAALKGGPLGFRNVNAAGLLSSALSLSALVIATTIALKSESTNATPAPAAGCPLPAVQETLAQIEGINLRTEAMRASIPAARGTSQPAKDATADAAAISADEPHYEFTWN